MEPDQENGSNPAGSSLEQFDHVRGAEERAGIIAAAQYVRMSTYHQRYSIEHQLDEIARYAARHRMEIVRTYVDRGKSGLRIEGREALKQLVRDSEKGPGDFSVILVYDISRWGRFQDADESAYYEYVCRRAGIEVRYCAERFENDGGIVSTIVKTLKRAMAGEFSRELSVKVFAGQSRLMQLGFWQGSRAGYGFRRLQIDREGIPRGRLGFGDRKSLHTDRVLLERGPDHEIKTVGRMFEMFVNEQLSERQIAEALNREGIRTNTGAQWRAVAIHRILENEKYIGTAVYNRVSKKLKGRRVVNPQEKWIRSPGAWPALVDQELFAAAQSILNGYISPRTDDEMLGHLQRLYFRGAISARIIDDARGPMSSAYRRRFGSLGQAYELAGIAPNRALSPMGLADERRRQRLQLQDLVVAGIQKGGSTTFRIRGSRRHSVNGEFTLSIVATAVSRTGFGRHRWFVRLPSTTGPHITIVARLNGENDRPLDYYLVPSIDIAGDNIRVAEHNAKSVDLYRFPSLLLFFRLVARTPIKLANTDSMRLAAEHFHQRSEQDASLLALTTQDSRLLDCVAVSDGNFSSIGLPSLMLLREDQLQGMRTCSSSDIERKYGFRSPRSDAVSYLLNKADNKLLVAVDHGTVPLEIAIEIARAPEGSVQRGLTVAYVDKLIGEDPISTIRLIIDQRDRKGISNDQPWPRRAPSATSGSLLRGFQNETDRQRSLLVKLRVAQDRMDFIVAALGALLQEEYFVLLLLAGGVSTIPTRLAERLGVVDVSNN
jgi:DNA invertase Pin-like site-specific DNA recombinase